jgi:hypothetical protein
METRLDISRRISYHTRFLQQVAKSDYQIDVAWNLEEIRRSLSFIAEHGDKAGSSAILAAGRIFARTHDEETRRACLDSLSRITSPKAKNELLRISLNKDLDQSWKDTLSTYISQTNKPQAPATVVNTRSGSGRLDQ